jgi:type IV secretory pathway VirB4 component
MQSYEHGASPSGYPLKPILQQKGPNGEGQCDHPGWNNYAMLGLTQKELSVLLGTGSNSRLALVRDDQGSVVIDADLSALGPYLTILGGMEKGEALVGADYRQNPNFWRQI